MIRGYMNIGMTGCLKEIMKDAIERRHHRHGDRHGDGSFVCEPSDKRTVPMSALSSASLPGTPSHTMSHVEHPEYDEIQIDCACEIICRYRPDLLLTHPGYVDSERHRTGLFSPYVSASVKKSEEWIGRLIQATKDAGIYEDTDFVILSDHGHLPYSKIVRLNKLFTDEGLISIDGEGHVIGWDAYAHSCDLSAQIYVSRAEDAELTGRVGEMLRKWRDEGNAGIEDVMEVHEAEHAYGLKGDFSFVIEAAEGYHFSDEWQGEAIYEEPPAAPGLGHSAHGHRPEKGPQPVFIGFGPDFEKGKVIDGGSVLEYFAMFRRILEV